MDRRFTLIIFLIMICAAPVIALGESKFKDAIAKINSDGDEFSLSMNGDENHIIFSRKKKDSSDADLYESVFKNNSWSKPERIKELSSTSDDRSPYISKDGNFILFSSNREDSLEDNTGKSRSYDIYYSEKIDGNWTQPIQIYGAINTKSDEFNPFLSDDEKTIIFTRGKINQPNRCKIIKVINKEDFWQDVETYYIPFNDANRNYMYRSSIIPDSFYLSAFGESGSKNRDILLVRGKSEDDMEVINPGKTVNTPGDEISLWETKERTLIVSTRKEGAGENYNFRVIGGEKSILSKPSKTLTLTITNIDDFVSPPRLKAMLFDTAERTAEPVKTGIIIPDKNGFVKISAGKNIVRIVIIPAESNSAEFVKEYSFNKKNSLSGKIVIETDGQEGPFRLKPVFFRFGSSAIDIAYVPYLHRLVRVLRENKEKTIHIKGFADGHGSVNANLKLGITRAEKVKKYLTSMGVSSDRIVIEKTTLYRKDSSFSTDQNSRRVDFKFGG